MDIQKKQFHGLNRIYREEPLKLILTTQFLDPGNLTCAVPQGSILGPLFLLLHENDIPRAVKCDLSIYAADTCLTFQHEHVKEIEEQLNLGFSIICDWFINNNLSIHLSEGKTKSILFGTKFNVKLAEGLNIFYGNVKIKQLLKLLGLVSFLMNLCQGDRWCWMFLIKSTLESGYSIDKIGS